VDEGAEERCLAAMLALTMQSDVQREKHAPPGHEVVLLVLLHCGNVWDNVDDDLAWQNCH
jgi:hypothetical protein